MCTTPPRRSTRRDPGELIAATPTMLGFHPNQSLVMIVYTGRGADHDLASLLRIDFPEPEQRNAWLDQLRTVIANQHAASVVLIAFGDRSSAAGTTPATAVRDDHRPSVLPHADLIEALSSALASAGTKVLDALWVPNGTAETWHSYRDTTRQGTIPDPATLPVAAEMVLAGVVTYASREGMAAVLAPDPAEHLARRTEIIAALPAVQSHLEIRFMVDLVRRAAKSTGDTGPGASDLDDAAIARLAHALADSNVFTGALALCIGPWGTGAQELWLTLLRGAPLNLRANPAALYAACAYLNGDGALASIAVEVAEQSEPDHPLVGLIRRVAGAGTHPVDLHSALTAVISVWADRQTSAASDHTEHVDGGTSSDVERDR